jgi:hypothetical protein
MQKWTRQDVINLLAEKFDSGNIPEPYMWANDILDILERRVGMLPPPIKTLIDVKTLCHGLQYKGSNPQQYPDTISHSYTENWELKWFK